MGHPQNDFANTERRCVFDDVIQKRDQGLPAFEGEALLPEKFRV
jgi:hypothetical protein